jgi:hypothetical protein
MCMRYFTTGKPLDPHFGYVKTSDIVIEHCLHALSDTTATHYWVTILAWTPGPKSRQSCILDSFKSREYRMS